MIYGDTEIYHHQHILGLPGMLHIIILHLKWHSHCYYGCRRLHNRQQLITSADVTLPSKDAPPLIPLHWTSSTSALANQKPTRHKNLNKTRNWCENTSAERGRNNNFWKPPSGTTASSLATTSCSAANHSVDFMWLSHRLLLEWQLRYPMVAVKESGWWSFRRFRFNCSLDVSRHAQSWIPATSTSS